MNRREFFKGLAAVLVAAQIPITAEALEAIPETNILIYLRRVQKDLIEYIIYPPMLMHEDGRLEILSTEIQQEALRHVSRLIKEYEDAGH